MVTKLQNERKKNKHRIRSTSPYKRPFSTESLLEAIKDRSLNGYVQRDLVVPNELKAKIANFPPIFKNTFSKTFSNLKEMISVNICENMQLKMIFLNIPNERLCLVSN